MSCFKAKMHQSQFRLGLCPTPHWGSSQHAPDPLNGFEGVLLIREVKGMGGRDGKEKGRKRTKAEKNYYTHSFNGLFRGQPG